ncbi:MAG TPA: hypothetical protein VLK33_12615, partial [Terriglobales bacterium]|nr:hypothetical protein [Terriglobales bacterium]
MRLDIARILKRFHFCERSITVAQAAWLASLAPIEVKITLPRFLWEDALTGDELRNRVFELRFPSRFLEVGNDAPVVNLFDDAIDSPSPLAFILSLARVYKPIQLEAYNSYLSVADSIADGPSIRFLRIAVQDKLDQIQILGQFAQEMRATATDAQIEEADAWV